MRLFLFVIIVSLLASCNTEITKDIKGSWLLHSEDEGNDSLIQMNNEHDSSIFIFGDNQFWVYNSQKSDTAWQYYTSFFRYKFEGSDSITYALFYPSLVRQYHIDSFGYNLGYQIKIVNDTLILSMLGHKSYFLKISDKGPSITYDSLINKTLLDELSFSNYSDLETSAWRIYKNTHRDQLLSRELRTAYWLSKIKNTESTTAVGTKGYQTNIDLPYKSDSFTITQLDMLYDSIHRVFVVIDSSKASNHDLMTGIICQILDCIDCPKNVYISFFSESKYAHYASNLFDFENATKEDVKRYDEWMNYHFVGEYCGIENTYSPFPMARRSKNNVDKKIQCGT